MPRADSAGAANCLKLEGDEIVAENFDGIGLVRDIERNLGVPLAGKRVSVDKGKWDASAGLAADHDFNVKWLRACQRVLKPSGTIWVSGTHHVIFSIGFAMGVVALQQRIALQLAIDIGVQLEARQLQQLDGLLQLRRDDKALALPNF